jgi:hypothetical protein
VTTNAFDDAAKILRRQRWSRGPGPERKYGERCILSAMAQALGSNDPVYAWRAVPERYRIILADVITEQYPKFVTTTRARHGEAFGRNIFSSPVIAVWNDEFCDGGDAAIAVLEKASMLLEESA